MPKLERMGHVTGTRSPGVRSEIQTLRAVAVLSVVIYHLWPGVVGGGFVGVDMFFAISGFLITAHLVREAEATGKVAVAAFWARRIRRLLPASLLVLALTGLAVWAFISNDLWKQFYREIGAAALYVENWALAADSVNYLAADNLLSPVQHYWSLSVEEQFYLVTPFVVVLATLVARRWRKARPTVVLAVALGVISAASFLYSMHLTVADPGPAYFSTLTRAWEFGAGGLLALALPSAPLARPVVRTALSWSGWALIAISLFSYSSATPFPGSAAAQPVVGTLLVIAAGDEGLRFSPTTIGRLRPVQFVGDISYSVYLYHWPLLIIAPYALGAPSLSAPQKAVIVVLSLVLGWLSKRFVEDPAQRGVLARRRSWVSFAAMAVGMSVVIGAASVGTNYVENAIASDLATAQQLVGSDVPCFGAAARDSRSGSCEDNRAADDVIPSPIAAEFDMSETWNECRSADKQANECVLGVPGGTRVLLVGDSHTHHWLPAVLDIAEQRRWEVHMFVRGGCGFSHVNWERRYPAEASACALWNERVDATLASQEPYELGITSMMAQANSRPLPDQSTTEELFAESWQPLIDRGALVVGIRDVPIPDESMRFCLANDSAPAENCLTDREQAFMPRDYLADAADALPGAASVDLTPYFCDETECPAVIGGVRVHRDTHHITKTFARTLAPYLDSAIAEAQRALR